MNDESIGIPLSCKSEGMDTDVNIHLDVATMVAIAAAAQFVFENQEAFMAQYKCTDCFERIVRLHGAAGEVIQASEQHQKLKKGDQVSN